MKDLSPRDGANVPKRENMTAAEKAVMAEVEKLTQSETVAFAMLAKEQQLTRMATEDCADHLRDIKDMLVLTLKNFSVALPAALAKAIEDGDYDPNELPGPDEDEGEDDEA